MSSAVEVKKSAPVVADVDVLVAGGGISGPVAALTAARSGASTMIVDRFGCLGGNMGPGMFSGGVLHLALGFPHAMAEGLQGVPGEFINRCEGYADGQLGHDYFRDSQVVSYVWFRLLRENGVRMLLNSFVTDPIMESDRVAGLIVENKSGAQAVRAKVVVDATGDADVAFRAGAPTDPDEAYMHPGMYFAIAGVDETRYGAFLEGCEQGPEELVDWLKRMKDEVGGRTFGLERNRKLIALFKQAWERGEYRCLYRIGDLATVSVDHGFYPPRRGIVGAQVGLDARKKLHSGDAAMVTELEAGTRQFIFETAQFMRRHVPGFEDSYLHMIAPYFHFRGGRSIKAEYMLTKEDVKEGRRFDDVVFVVYGAETQERAPEGNDMPYRQLLPQKIEGLLVTGRAAIVQPPVMRDRWKMLMMGQVAGLAAALAARDGVAPRRVNVRELQKVLHQKYHAPLGNEARLRELGLV